ncbi:hypothetical protein T439DRAFT_120845 [Meredithblackwellia eburnea MCA 4105]
MSDLRRRSSTANTTTNNNNIAASNQRTALQQATTTTTTATAAKRPSPSSRPHFPRNRSSNSNSSTSNSPPPHPPSQRQQLYSDDGDDDETATMQDDDHDHKSSRTHLSPPKDPELFDTEEEWRRYHAQDSEPWPHHLPLVLVALPPLGAIVHGRADNWSDAIILLLVCFYLYQLVKVPWTIYRASHARYVLHGSISGQTDGAAGATEDPITAARRHYHVQALRRNELLSLLMTMVVPVAGSYLLFYVKYLLSDPDHYINKTTISLFALATSVKPVLHFGKLVKRNSLYHQEGVWYPSTDIHLLRRRMEALERDLSQLTRAFATKDDVRTLRDGVDVPLSQLSRAVRRWDRKEEYLRMSTEERFSLLDQRLEMASRELANNAELIDGLRTEHERLANPINAIFHAIRAVVGHQVFGGGPGGLGGAAGRRPLADRRPKELKWFQRGPLWLILWPVNVSSLAIEWVSTGRDDLPGRSFLFPLILCLLG